MKLLITGAFGCVGGRLAQHLSAGGTNEILLGTRNATRSPSWMPDAKVVRTDWESQPNLESVCKGADAVVHLAGMNAQDSVAQPEGALEMNGRATARLADAAANAGVARLIYFSTAHVYASPLAGRITEDTPLTNDHPYAASHLAGERAVLLAGEKGTIAPVVMRLSNSYGAPAHRDANCWMLLVNDLCRQAVVEKALTLKTSGLQRRDFIPLAEVSRAVEHLLTIPRELMSGRVFNVGGNWAPTVLEMAELIQQRSEVVLGERPSLSHAIATKGELTPDLEYLTEAFRSTGFEPRTDRAAEIDGLLRFCERELA